VKRYSLQTLIGHSESVLVTVVDHLLLAALRRFLSMKAVETINNMRTGETLTVLVNEEENGGTGQLYQVRLAPRRPSRSSTYL